MSKYEKQIADLKRQHPDKLVLFRCGDFYELFGDDALAAAKCVGLSVTTRYRGEDRLPMVGFPHHSLELYLRKLLEAGHRVAVAEQVP